MLILDDATSSVDATTEREIKTALREVMEGRTTFVIAHRLSTIALADDIVVLEQGRVIARAARTTSCSTSRRCTPRSPPRGCPTRSSSTAIRSRGWRGYEPRRRDDLVRRWRATSGRGRKLRGLAALLAPYRDKVILMFVSLLFATAAALAPPPLAKLAIDRASCPAT